jgi:hypothetical protein
MHRGAGIGDAGRSDRGTDRCGPRIGATVWGLTMTPEVAQSMATLVVRRRSGACDASQQD